MAGQLFVLEDLEDLSSPGIIFFKILNEYCTVFNVLLKLEPIHCIREALMEDDDMRRRTDDVFTGRDKGKRRMSPSIHRSLWMSLFSFSSPF